MFLPTVTGVQNIHIVVVITFPVFANISVGLMYCLQLLMELQKVAFKADDEDQPVQTTLSSFAAQLGTIIDKQLKVLLPSVSVSA